MPVITVRRSDRQQSEDKALEIISQAEFGHLATITNDGYPYVIPVNHALVGRRILIHCAQEGHKLDNIRRNPRVCFEVSKMLEITPGAIPCRYSVKYESAVAFGRARIVTAPEDKVDALRALARKYAGKDGPFEPYDLERVVVIEIEIEVATCKVRR